MKKLMLILPILLLVTLAWGQNTGMDPNRVNNTKALDGKSYKITLTASAMDHSVIDSKTMNNDKTHVDPKTNNPDLTKDTYDESGNVVTKDNRSDRAGDAMKKDYQGNKDKTIDGNKDVILRFENGMVTSSLTNSSIGGNCQYTTTNTVDATITFTADCSTTTSKSNDNASTSVSSSTKWSGTVEGKNIKGNLYMTDENGMTSSYTFIGIESKDSTKNLGVK